MSLKRKAVEGIMVAGSLAVMCSIADVAEITGMKSVSVRVEADTELAARGTAGVVTCLDLLKAEALDSMETAADVRQLPVNLVASAEKESVADEAAMPMTELTENVSGKADEQGIADTNPGNRLAEAGAEENIEGGLTAGSIAEITKSAAVPGESEDRKAVLTAGSIAEIGKSQMIAVAGIPADAENEPDPAVNNPEDLTDPQSAEPVQEAENQVVPERETGDAEQTPVIENDAEQVPVSEEIPDEAESSSLLENTTRNADAALNEDNTPDAAELPAVTEDVPVQPDMERADEAADVTVDTVGADQQPETNDSPEAVWNNRLMADVNEFLYVRTEGNQEAEIEGKLYKGDVAEIVEAGAEWTHIVSGNVEGYVKNEYCVSGLDAFEYATANFDTEAEIQTDGLRVRSAADAESSVLTSVSSGTTLPVDTSVETDGEWIAVKYKGATAFVSADYVTTDLALGEAVTIEEERAAAEAAARAKAEEAAKAAQAAQSAQVQTVQKSSVSASVDDVTLLAALIQCEAGSESYEGQLAVGAVVMNRVRSGSYAGSVYGVIYEGGQFSPAGSGAVARVAASGPKASCIQAAQQALGGADNTGGATCFRRVSSGRQGLVIGNHVFFN